MKDDQETEPTPIEKALKQLNAQQDPFYPGVASYFVGKLYCPCEALASANWKEVLIEGLQKVKAAFDTRIAEHIEYIRNL